MLQEDNDHPCRTIMIVESTYCLSNVRGLMGYRKIILSYEHCGESSCLGTIGFFGVMGSRKKVKSFWLVRAYEHSWNWSFNLIFTCTSHIPITVILYGYTPVALNEWTM